MALPILVLDDQEERLNTFRRHFEHYLGGVDEVIYVRCAQEAKEAIERVFKFKSMYLDHDLGPTIGNGRDVAKLICELPDDRIPDEVIVHSMNYAAGKDMCADLDDRGIRCFYTPFHTLGLFGKDH